MAPASCRWGPRRDGFTLTELVVSIGILSLMMAMVGTVFKLTLDSTGQATALIKTTQYMRLLEEGLREDLALIDPASSIMVIDPYVINAYWRTEQAELDPDGDPSTGYPHDLDPERDTTTLDPNNRPKPELPRADVLMFFTSRRTTSYVCPDVWSNLVQVVYGHADLGELDPPPNPPPNDWINGVPPDALSEHPWDWSLTYPQTPTQLNLPPLGAETWHLARRSVLIVDGVVTGDCASNGLVEFALEKTGANNWPDKLLDGEHDVVGKDPTDIPGSFDFLSDVVGLTGLGTVDLPDWFARSRLDLTPPAMLGKRLGHYLLPHCASFKVEWAIDLRDSAFAIPFGPGRARAPRELIWIDSAAPDPGVATPLVKFGTLAQRYDDDGAPPGVGVAIRNVGREIADRFRTAAAALGTATPLTPLWFANDSVNVNPTGSPTEPDRYFPKALRITVDVYDEAGRFDRPTRHVMVLPVGGG